MVYEHELLLLTGTSVFRHFLHVGRVFAGEPEPQHAAPVVGYLEELDEHLFVDGHRATAERHAFAETVHPSGDEPVLVQPHVFAVHAVEPQGRQIKVDCAGARFRCCKRAMEKQPLKKKNQTVPMLYYEIWKLLLLLCVCAAAGV